MPSRMLPLAPESDHASRGLRRVDFALLAAYCAVLFGISLVGGRVLSRHEGVLPQSAREMLVDHDWVVPKSGGRPWLESPPLPQWITVGVASLAGHADEEWIVRIAPALVAMAVVLMVAWMAAGWFGRTIGMLSGLVMATLSEFTRYAWLAEDEIFLCGLVTAAVALFVRLEFFGGLRAEDEPYRFFGLRPRGMLWFFIALGATNLAKGVIFGTVMALVPIVGYLASGLDWRRLRPYCWFWGWVAFVLVGGAWPLAALSRYPDVAQVWFYDQIGRVSGNYTAINQPVWYYLLRLPEEIAPWTLVAPLGMWLTWRKAASESRSAERFLWCWAILTPAVLSIPSGKHHHYLLHCLVPWSIFAALAVVWIRDKVMSWPAWARNPWGSLGVMGIPGGIAIGILGSKAHLPVWGLVAAILVWLALGVIFSWGIWHPNGRLATATLFIAVGAGYCGGHVYAGKSVDRYRFDTAFLKQVRATVPTDRPLLINAGMGQLEAFHTLFYLEPRTIALHNLTFLLDERIAADDVYLVTYHSDAEELTKYGTAVEMFESECTWRDGLKGDNLTLFHLTFGPHLARVSGDVRISPMQAMFYAHGPYLGPAPIAISDRRGTK